MLKIVTPSGLPLANGITSLLRRAVAHLNMESGPVMADAMTQTVRRHFASNYPGSDHWSPKKVNPSPDSAKNTAVVDIDVPGVTRAYKSLTIRPKVKQYLTVPIHKTAYGHPASDFIDLFFLKKKNGKAFLAQQLNNGGIRFIYFLAKRVHQPRNPDLMPSDNELRRSALGSVKPLFEKALNQELQNI